MVGDTISPQLLQLILGGMQFGGGLLQGVGQGQQSAEQARAAQQNALLGGQLGLNQDVLNAYLGMYGQQASQGYQRDVQGLNAMQMNPLAQQQARQQMALRAAILPELRNPTTTLPRGLQGYAGQLQGGFRIPEGGFGPETLRYFSPEANAAAEGHFWQAAAPFVRPPDLTQLGYGAAGQVPTMDAMAARNTFDAQQEEMRRNQLGAIQNFEREGQNALAKSQQQQQQQQQQRKSSWWRRLLGTALPIAAGFIPGVGPLAALGIHAAAGAGGAALAGGNPLSGAIGGAALGALGGRFPLGGGGSVPTSSIASPLTNSGGVPMLRPGGF